MNDDAYTNAIRRKEVLEAELQDINRFLELYQRFANGAASRSLLPLMETERRTEVSILPRIGGSDGTKRSKRGPIEFAKMAEDYIRSAGHPLTRSELVDVFIADGIDLPSEDKARYLGTILWRNRERFINVPGRGYTLEEMLTQDDRRRLEQQAKPLSEGEISVLRKIAKLQAENVHQRRREILALWNDEGQIPSDVDRRLLGAAKTTLNNDDLATADKRRLREMFIAELKAA